MRKGILLLIFALTACVGTQMEKGLRSLVGDPIGVATSTLGYPDGQRTMMGDTIYVWSTDHQAYLPTVTGTYGNVGGVGFSQNTYGLMGVRAQCVIQLGVDANGTIKNWQYHGNPIGCRNYARALNP